MGARANQARNTRRKIRAKRLSDQQRRFLRENASYEGSPCHKRNPGDFNLTPPSNPRPDKTLCDEAAIFDRATASALLMRAIDAGLVSEEDAGAAGFPKQLWVVHEGRVYEAMYGGSQSGCYHGYPIRKTDPFFEQVLQRWSEE